MHLTLSTCMIFPVWISSRIIHVYIDPIKIILLKRQAWIQRWQFAVTVTIRFFLWFLHNCQSRRFVVKKLYVDNALSHSVNHFCICIQITDRRCSVVDVERSQLMYQIGSNYVCIRRHNFGVASPHLLSDQTWPEWMLMSKWRLSCMLIYYWMKYSVSYLLLYCTVYKLAGMITLQYSLNIKVNINTKHVIANDLKHSYSEDCEWSLFDTRVSLAISSLFPVKVK